MMSQSIQICKIHIIFKNLIKWSFSKRVEIKYIDIEKKGEGKSKTYFIKLKNVV